MKLKGGMINFGYLISSMKYRVLNKHLFTLRLKKFPFSSKHLSLINGLRDKSKTQKKLVSFTIDFIIEWEAVHCVKCVQIRGFF